MANIQERRDKDGRLISFSIRVHRGRGADGKQLKPWTATFDVSPTWKEESARKKAEAFAATFEEKCKNGVISDERKTFQEYCEYVLSLKKGSGTKISTIEWYRSLTEKIYPEIGFKKLKDIRASDLNILYRKLSQTKIEPKTARAIVNLEYLLKQKHLTRKDIASETGLSVNTVSIAVRGDNCSIETAKKISDFLEIKFEKSFLVLNQNKTLSGKTVSGYHRLISVVLKQAVKEGLIPINVAANTETPKPEHKKIASLQTVELPSILNALENEPLKWRVIIHLLMITGARRGEILGLRWNSIDFANNRIHIDNNVLYIPSVGVYQDKPKTENSIRWISVPTATMELLRDWKAFQKEIEDERGEYFNNPDELLFTRDDGSPMFPDSVTTYLRRFSEKYNLPHINPHKFRHTMASMLLYKKVDPVSVSRRLGHSQVSTTTDIYADIIAEADVQNAEFLGEIFLRKA